MTLTKEQKIVIRTTYRAHRPMSIKEISEKSHMSWFIAKKHINILVRKKWLLCVKGKRDRFEFNYDKLGGI